ncbi:MAG: FmdB family zinc ribbon protein [Candidatus Methylomirabilaceae bacterium]
MPIYEYLCSSCGRVFEQLVLGRSARVACPRCPDAAVEKQFSAFSFKGERGFVGSGGG